MLNPVRGFIDLEEFQIVATGDVDQHAARTLQRHIVEQWVRDGFLSGINSAAFALCFACAHHGFAHLTHYGPHIGEIEVDEARHDHQVGNALDALVENIVRQFERVHDGRVLGRDAEQVLVRNDDQRINVLLKLIDAFVCQFLAAAALKRKRLSDNTDREHAQLASCFCDDGRCARPGATAHTGGDETHIRTRQVVNDFIDGFFGCVAPNLWTHPCAEALRDVIAELDTARGRGALDRLRIRIRNNEVRAFQIVGFCLL